MSSDCHEVIEGRDDTPTVERTFACPHSEDEILHDYQAEKGRELANRRDDLIAEGVDPADLEIPIHLDDQEQP